MKLVSIVTPVFNEETNIELLYDQVSSLFKEALLDYDYEYIFIDNCSTDETVPLLRGIAKKDKKVKVILNARNFGQLRSPYHALFQTQGEATILIAADLQEPPDLIVKFVEEWANGYKVVVGIKTKSDENFLMYGLRSIYYNLIERFAESEQIKHFTGFGLYDKSFITCIKNLNDPYPYLRGLITELGFERKEIEYRQSARKHGKTKNNFYSLYDVAMLGFVNHSKVPLRMATFIGFLISLISISVAIFYFIAKILFWDIFQAGTAPMVIGLFFFASVQLIFIGIIGEYIGAIYTQVKNRPLVIEKERINFLDTVDEKTDKS